MKIRNGSVAKLVRLDFQLPPDISRGGIVYSARLVRMDFQLPPAVSRGGIVSGSSLYLWHPDGIVEMEVSEGIRGTIEVLVTMQGSAVTGIVEMGPSSWPIDPETTLRGELERLTVLS